MHTHMHTHILTHLLTFTHAQCLPLRTMNGPSAAVPAALLPLTPADVTAVLQCLSTALSPEQVGRQIF